MTPRAPQRQAEKIGSRLSEIRIGRRPLPILVVTISAPHCKITVWVQNTP